VANVHYVPVEVRDNADEQRYEATVDGELAGFTAYRLGPGLITFVHTEVDDAFEGHGVASTLVSEALGDARRGGLDVLPVCPFVNSYIEKHPEYLDLVPESRREAFGL
jgi:predicted GNAT family acetyltransferase